MNNYHRALFTEGKIGSKKVKNRIIMSPMGEEMSLEDGRLSKESIAYYVERAKGGAGVIMTGATCVDFPKGSGLLSQLALDDEKHVEGFKTLADAVHKEGALLIPQLYYAGLVTSMEKTKGLPIKCVSNVKMFAKSMVKDFENAIIEELTIEEIKALVQKFIDSALLAKKAGCDGVGIHGGHAYLINQFFAKAFNKRKDIYGGKFENRIRFAVEIVEGIKKACGKDFPIVFRIAARDFIPFGLGLSEKEVNKIIDRLTEAGVDLFDITGGIDVANKKSMCVEPQGYKEAFRANYAKGIKEISRVPVSTVGVIRTPKTANKLIEDGIVDFVTLGRALICDPYWAKKAEEGKDETIRKCISCNEGCFSPIILNIHKPITCALNPMVSRESKFVDNMKSKDNKNVIVIGSGPAGIQAALTASDRGHKVTLLEKNNKVGGQLNIAAVPPGKEFMKDALQWFIREIHSRENIELKLNFEATAENIKKLNPEHIIIATGAQPFNPPIKGIENTVSSWSILNGETKMPSNKKVVVIGGGIVGAETAHYIGESSNKVSILEMNSEIAPGMEPYNKIVMMRELKGLKVKMLTSSKVMEINKDSVVFDSKGKQKNIKSDLVVMALGQRPHGADLLESLKETNVPVVSIGDMNKVGKIISATEAGFLAAMDI